MYCVFKVWKFTDPMKKISLLEMKTISVHAFLYLQLENVDVTDDFFKLKMLFGWNVKVVGIFG